MAARAGMANLITDLRRVTSAGTADHTIAGETFFTDDQVQAVLDKYRSVYKFQPLQVEETLADGTTYYYDYLFPVHIKRVEEAGAGGTTNVNSGWRLTAGDGSTAPSYTVNHYARQILFAADTGGTTYYLDCREYDMNRAASEMWEMKAGFVAQETDWSSDNHRIAASQKQKAYLEQAKRYRSLSGVKTGVMRRKDEYVW